VVIGVQAEKAPSAYLSWRAGKPVEATTSTWAEGLATRTPFELPQRILRRLLDDFILVSDEAISAAVRFLLARNRSLVEGAGASSLAAALALKDRLAGQRVALILTGGNISIPQLKAVLDDAQRNLDLTTVRAPMAGVATQVDQIQLGRFVVAGTPVFSIIDTSKPWVDANPKESDFTYVAVGQPVTIDVDAFPDHVFKGTIGSLSPGTGAQFAILPPQNATGNFVKVVQRVPVRIYFDSNDKYVRKLKAGMSAYTSIDTGHRRTLAALFGFAPAAKD